MHEPFSSASILAHAFLAILGAVVHASKAHRLGESKTVVDFLTLIVMSSFSGAMFALIGFQFFSDQIYLTMAMAGTGGYIGVEGMTLIVERVKSIIQQKK